MRRQDRIDEYLEKNPHATERQLMRKFGLSWDEAQHLRQPYQRSVNPAVGWVSSVTRWLRAASVSDHKVLWSLVALAATVRIVYAFFLWRDPALTTPILDAEYYVKWAEEIVKNGWLGDRIFFTEPFYAYFLAALITVFGAFGTELALIVQFSLGVAVPVVLYFVGQRLFDRVTGIVAGVIAALYGPFIFYEGLLLKTSFEIFFLSLFLLVILRAFEEKSWQRFFFAGALLGFTVLVKGNNLVFVPIIVSLLLFSRSLDRRMKWRLAAVFSFGVALCILPVTLRNYAVGHDFVPTNFSIGLVMYQGSWWGSDGSTAKVPPFLRPHPKYEEMDAVGMAEAYAGEDLQPSEVSRFWMQKSWEEMRAAPGHYLATLANKLFLIIHPIEFSDNYSYSFYRSSIPVLRILIPFWLILPFFCLGAFFLIRRQWAARGDDRMAPTLALLMLTAYIGVLLLTTINSRYRVPLMPFGILLSASAVVILWRFFQRREITRLLWSASFVSVFLVFLLAGLLSPRYALIEANAYHAIGYAALERGEYDEAKTWFQRTIALDPRYGWAYGNLMLVALFEGDLPQAKEYLKTLIVLRSDDLSNYDRLHLLRSLEQATPAEMRERAKAYLTESVAPDYDADFYESQRLLALKDTAGAEAALNRSIARDEDNEAALIALAGLKKRSGEPMKAVEYLRRAVAANPDNFIARYNLANAYIETQNFSQVASLLKDIYDFTPELGDTWYNYAVALAKLGKFDEAVPITQAYVERYQSDPSKQEKVVVFEKALEASKKNGLEGLLKKGD